MTLFKDPSKCWDSLNYTLHHLIHATLDSVGLEEFKYLELCIWDIRDINGEQLSLFIRNLSIHSNMRKYSTCNDLFKFKMYSPYAQHNKLPAFEQIQTY